MTENSGKFSQRYGFSSPREGGLIRDSAPESLRCGLLQVVHDEMRIGPQRIRQVVCGVLRVRPDPSNWSTYPNVWDEAQELVYDCEWFRVYDIIEGFYTAMPGSRRSEFEELINNVFVEESIGWQVVSGVLEIRGNEVLQNILDNASSELDESGLATATSELHEAIKDLSRRPEPDLSGAIHHAMAALECVAREVSGKPKLDLGKLIKKHPDLFPKPIGEAVAKLWGYASEQARHGRESRELAWEEAQLVVGISAVLCAYLLQKPE